MTYFKNLKAAILLATSLMGSMTFAYGMEVNNEEKRVSLVTKQQQLDEDFASIEEDEELARQIKMLKDNASAEEDEELAEQSRVLRNHQSDDGATTEEDLELTQHIKTKLDILQDISIQVEYLSTTENQKVVEQIKLFKESNASYK
jgi:hypothetical protein